MVLMKLMVVVMLIDAEDANANDNDNDLVTVMMQVKVILAVMKSRKQLQITPRKYSESPTHDGPMKPRS